jgi:CheY-like chemotaxis protein
MEASSERKEKLVLLVDSDVETRFVIQPLLRPYGLELVIARAGIVALEVMQRMANRFRLALVSMELPGISGKVVYETLRHFRPTLPVLCLSASAQGGGTACLPKPIQAVDIAAWLGRVLGGTHPDERDHLPGAAAAPDALSRAQSRYGMTGSLLDAARELARGMPGEGPTDW